MPEKKKSTWKKFDNWVKKKTKPKKPCSCCN